MSTPVRVVGFLAVLAALFGVSPGVGNAIGPVSEPAAQEESHGAGHGAVEQETIPGGRMIAQDGYALDLADPTLAPEGPCRWISRSPATTGAR